MARHQISGGDTDPEHSLKLSSGLPSCMIPVPTAHTRLCYSLALAPFRLSCRVISSVLVSSVAASFWRFYHLSPLRYSTPRHRYIFAANAIVKPVGRHAASRRETRASLLLPGAVADGQGVLAEVPGWRFSGKSIYPV